MTVLAVSVLPVLIALVFFAIPIVLLVLVYKAYNKNVKRAEDQLNVEKQRTFTMQKQLDELNERLVKVERLLKEVE